MRTRMSITSPRGRYICDRKFWSSSPLNKLRTPWGNSVVRNINTTVSNMAVVLLALLSTRASPLAVFLDAPSFFFRFSASFKDLTSSALSTLKSKHGSILTTIACIQKLKLNKNSSAALLSQALTLKLTSQIRRLSLTEAGEAVRLTVVKFGMQMTREAMKTNAMASLARAIVRQAAPLRWQRMKMYLRYRKKHWHINKSHENASKIMRKALALTFHYFLIKVALHEQ